MIDRGATVLETERLVLQVQSRQLVEIAEREMPRALICLFDPRNLASRRVTERVGFTFDREVLLDGERQPMHSLRARCTPAP